MIIIIITGCYLKLNLFWIVISLKDKMLYERTERKIKQMLDYKDVERKRDRENDASDDDDDDDDDYEQK